MGGSGYPDDPKMQRMIREAREKAKGAKPNDIIFLNQGGPPFLILESVVWSANVRTGDPILTAMLTRNLTEEEKTRLSKAKKLQIEVFD